MWKHYAADRCRFRRRIFEFNNNFGHIFNDLHRTNIRTVIDEQLNVDDVVDDVAALAL